MRAFGWAILTVLLLVGTLAAQGRGREIYSANAPSVLLLYAQSPDGTFVAQGTGFLITSTKIVTNAHVANAGKIFVDLGNVKLPTHIETTDSINDLAVLTTDAEISAPPLKLSNSTPSPGDTIYVIGNPQGLEKTISQGVLSGIRKLDGRPLLQLTASISHGSSGSPVFNSSGEVVGIAVGMLTEGQNLNFAIPVSELRRLLSAKGRGAKPATSILAQLVALKTEQDQQTFSDDPDSPWQKSKQNITSLLQGGIQSTDDADVLLKLSEVAEAEYEADLSIAAIERAVHLKPTSQAYLALASALSGKYIWLSNDERTQVMSQAESAARMALKSTRTPSSAMYYRLGDILEDKGQYKESDTMLRAAIASSKSSSDESRWGAMRDLARNAGAENNIAEEQNWFAELQAGNQATAWDWHEHAARLGQAGKLKEAGDAYVKSAASINRDWCQAGSLYTAASQPDLALYAHRQCIDKLTGTKGSEQALAIAHTDIAAILTDRGVYSEAVSHAKEATTLDPNNAWAFDALCASLTKAGRPQEAINAGKEAIRLSDGKYAVMHFDLGSAYFDAENWQGCAQSFQKAAELSPQDDASAYNTGLCLGREGYYLDEAHWFEEVLRRNPNRQDKQDLLRRIDILKR